ncbi:MAG: GNAT family N-acetyltransferase [Proteobacteria bacterium]|nr:GNAT family N-acetyltransferase [Pseudomonadota bacterium]
MTSFSLTTLDNPDWNKKIASGLRKECAQLTGNPEGFTNHSIYVTSGSTFVGGISIEQHDHILWLDSIWVEPTFRGQGVGKKLLQEAHLFATKNKAKEMQLNTYFQNAHTFFLTCGFEDIAVIPNWKWGLTCYLMRKNV